VLLAPTPEVHAVWLAALSQAAVPRASLLSQLKRVGALDETLKEFDDQTKVCFPTMGAAVISSSSCVRMDDQPPVTRQSTHRSSLTSSESLTTNEDRAIPSLKIQPSFIIRSSQAARNTTQRTSVPGADPPENDKASKPTTAAPSNNFQLIEPNRRSLRAVFGTTATSPTVEVIA